MPNLLDLTHIYTLIRLTGEKSDTFLQGQITCDIRDISSSVTRLAAHCNPKGRVLSSFRVLKYQDTFYLLTPRDMATYIIKQLTLYAQFSRVTLAVEEKLSILGCLGENSEDFLNNICQTIPSQPDEATNENHRLLIRLSGTSARFYMIADKEDILSLREKYSSFFTTDIQAWMLLDIQAGVATIHPETSNLFTPHMLNYPALNAVSFKKGCYTGQEVIARTHYLGKTKRTLQHLTRPATSPIYAGDVLYDDEKNEMGTVVNAVLNTEKNGYEILAVVIDQT